MNKLRVLDLFSGIGGFSLGLERTGGFETVAFCEIDRTNRQVLKRHWPDVQIFDDVRTIIGSEVYGANVICGGFPCQDASVANIDGAGTNGERTGLFREIIRLAGELGPDYIIMENVPNLLNRGFGDVLGALAEIGFDAEWDCISARELGGCHERERLWIVAYPRSQGWERPFQDRGVFSRVRAKISLNDYTPFGRWAELVASQRGIRIGDGVSLGMERRRLYALGNAVVPQIPELIGNAILEVISGERKAA